MGRIKIEDIKPGMTLANDVKNLSGYLLLRKDDRIAEKNIKIFKTWGITEIDVKGIGEDVSNNQSIQNMDPVVLNKIKSKTNVLFKHTDFRLPVIKELYRLCIKRATLQQINRQFDA